MDRELIDTLARFSKKCKPPKDRATRRNLTILARCGLIAVDTESWESIPTGKGVMLLATLDDLAEAKKQVVEEERLANIEHPRAIRRLSKRNQWEMSRHRLIEELRHQVLISAGQDDFPDEDSEDYTECVYTDGTYVLSLSVSLQDLCAGKYDHRFTHVLLTYPNMEDK